MAAALGLLFPVAGLAVAGLNVWATVRGPRDGQSYLWLAWALLLVAYLIGKRVRPGGRHAAPSDPFTF